MRRPFRPPGGSRGVLLVRPLVLGIAVACAGDDGGEIPRVDRPCTDGEPARCGFGGGADATRNAVLVCEGGQWSAAHDCGVGETCSDDDDRGAVSCTAELDQVIYGDHNGPCAVAGAQSCSFERDFVLVCEGGTWSIATNCSTDVLHCTYVTPDDDDACTEADGCFVCD